MKRGCIEEAGGCAGRGPVLTDLKLSLHCKGEHAVSYGVAAELLGNAASSQKSQPNGTVHP